MSPSIEIYPINETQSQSELATKTSTIVFDIKIELSLVPPCKLDIRVKLPKFFTIMGSFHLQVFSPLIKLNSRK